MRPSPNPVWGVPLPPDERIGLDRLAPRYCEPGRGDRLYVASDYLLSTNTHWVDGRSIFCAPGGCGVDHGWQKPIWMAYLHVCRVEMAKGGWGHYWLRVTPGAAKKCPLLGDIYCHLRGREITLRRVDTRYNARVEILLTGNVRQDVPPALDMRPFITQLVQADNLPQEERERRKAKRA